MSTSISPSTLDSLVADFKLRLDKTDKSSLQQWQFAYKEVIFAMGLKILEKFPRNALGPEPREEGHEGGGEQLGGGGEDAAGGGEEADVVRGPSKSPIKGRGPFADGGPPWGQGPIIHVVGAVLGLHPPPPPPPPPR
jgi:hypothetical protein